MNTIKKTLLSLAITLALPSMGMAAEHDARLLMLMNLIEQVPTKAQLQAAGATPEALLSIANDKALKRYPRARAASMIAHFDTPQARLHLAALLQDSQIKDSEVKVQALNGLVYLEGAGSFERLERLSKHDHPELRAAAVRNLGRIQHPGVQGVLRNRLVEGVESVAWIKDLARRTAQRTSP